MDNSSLADFAPRPEDKDTYKVDLHSTEGGSDKVYTVLITAKGAGWVVDVAYGRRGGPLKQETKTPAPVEYPAACKAAAKLLVEKVRKGYRPVGVEYGGASASVDFTRSRGHRTICSKSYAKRWRAAWRGYDRWLGGRRRIGLRDQ